MKMLKTEILIEIKFLQNLCTRLKERFDHEDMRISVFDGFNAILCNYFLEIGLTEQEYFIDTYKTIYNNKSIAKSNLETQIRNHINSANSQLVVDSWSNFELFISYVSKCIFNDEKKRKLLEEDYVEISNCLNKHEIDTSDINCLDKLKIRAFHLVQSSRKIASLLKVLKTKFSSDSNYKDTLGFLTNYGRLRNGIHSNFIFHGQKEVICLYDKITYSYKPNEPIIMEPLVEDTFYNNCKRLIGICIFIIENVVYEQKIYDPTYLITK